MSSEPQHREPPFTYVSLFSSAGVGCYGLHQIGMQCIATVEINERRLNIQRFNHKCAYETGYIAGDIRAAETHLAIKRELSRWRQSENVGDLDVLIATPPCQGMSVANHKKNAADHTRNSLVVESIRLVAEIAPRFFVFENVPAFMRTICTDFDGVERPISAAIERTLGDQYSIYARVINFMDYGASSSRTRTVVFGVRSDIAPWVSPMELMPTPQVAPTLRQIIGSLPPLTEMGQSDPDDALHRFRPYPEHMRAWIEELAEGESAFDNEDPARIPHRVVEGRVVLNQRKNGDKYRRQYWDRVGPCIHTRNDQLASQNTVHPTDDRVFSIRELMRMMTVPDEFRWFEMSLDELNALSTEQRTALFRREEMCIRQCLGEAVPTGIMRSIGERIVQAGRPECVKPSAIRSIAVSLAEPDSALEYVKDNPAGLALSVLSRAVELANAKRSSHAAYYTDRHLLTDIAQTWPELGRGRLRILEPAVGSGNFLPFLLARYGDAEALTIDALDIDADALAVARALVSRLGISERVQINYINADFLQFEPESPSKYDLIVGNPPFTKYGKRDTADTAFRHGFLGDSPRNASGLFMLRAMQLARHVSLVMPKSCLSTDEYRDFRREVGQHRIDSILDFGELGFRGVLVETVCIGVTPGAVSGLTSVNSLPMGLKRLVRQSYLTSSDFPAWLLYRDETFDEIACSLEFGVFEAFRDRQISNSMLSSHPGGIPVIRSRNIEENGNGLLQIPGYDAFIEPRVARGLAVHQFLDRDDVCLVPNMTYKPRAIRKSKGMLVNGSVAILIPKAGRKIGQRNLRYFASDEFRSFYRVARNHATRSMNIDSSSVKFFGLKRGV